MLQGCSARAEFGADSPAFGHVGGLDVCYNVTAAQRPSGPAAQRPSGPAADVRPPLPSTRPCAAARRALDVRRRDGRGAESDFALRAAKREDRPGRQFGDVDLAGAQLVGQLDGE